MNNIENYLFFAHQNRFKGYIIDTFNSLLGENNKIDEETRFSNGAILCLDITWIKRETSPAGTSLSNQRPMVFWDAKLILSLIYDGDKLANKKNKPYWVVGETNDYLKHFEKKTLDVSEEQFKSIFKTKTNIDKKPIRCYFVRHGFSEHNKGFFEKNISNIIATNTSLIGLDNETRTKINDLLTKVDKFKQSILGNDINIISLDDFKNLDIYTTLIDSELIERDDIANAFEETIKPNNNDDHDNDDDNDNGSIGDGEIGSSEDGDGGINNTGWRTLNPPTISKSDIGVFLENILNKIYIEKNGELQSILAGRAFSKILENDNTINTVFVSDLVRTQETAGFFLTQLTSSQLPPFTRIIVLPCLHELANGEKDGERKTGTAILKKGFSQFSKTGTLGRTAGVMNRENNTNCRATKEEEYIPGRWSLNQFERKDCSTININGKTISIDWELYKIFYKGYRDENKWGRKECKDHHFLGIFFDNYVLPENLIRIEEVVVNRIEKEGGKKRRQTKKHRVMKSKKVRRVKKLNKKSKKVKRRSNKRKA